MSPDTDTVAGIARVAPSAAGRGTTPSSGGSGPPRALASDFETFLRMLTVQMQNQDPLNPMASSDFAVQLATFSGVEQQVLTNDLLTGLATRLGSAPGLSDYASWVGMEARSAAPVSFEGAPVSLSLLPHPAAETGLLVVRDATGAVLQERPVAAGTETLSWDATLPGSPSLPPGSYDISVRWLAGGAAVAEWPVESYRSVTEVRMTPRGTVEIVLQGGAAVPAGAITAVRGAAPAGA